MQQRIINLGKSISEEFEKGDRPDTLSRWMAHYIAQLINQAEINNGEKSNSLNKKCFDSILNPYKKTSNSLFHKELV